jgi:hypothetical protein
MSHRKGAPDIVEYFCYTEQYFCLRDGSITVIPSHSSIEMIEEYWKSFKQRAARKDEGIFSAVTDMDVLSKHKRKNLLVEK